MIRTKRLLPLAPLLIVLATVWIAACDSPRYPELCGSIAEQTIVVGEMVTVDMCFEDPDGEMLDFEVFNSDAGVATAVASGSTVTVTAVSPGTALVTMVATDPTGLKAQQNFRVVVPNRPPTAVGMIDDRELMVGDSVVIDATGYFTEPDGQALSYTVAVSDSTRLAASVEGAAVTLIAQAKGTVAVTVTAADPGGLTAMQSFRIRIPNRPPVPVDSIPPREIMVDRADSLDLSRFFSDPDEDPLTYVAAVSDSAVAAASVSGSVLTVTGVAKGRAEVTVTATDDEGLWATQRFAVTVPNRPPVVADTIRPRRLFRDEADTVELAAYFYDPDGDALTWGVEVSDSAVVALDLSAPDGRLTVTALSQGEAVVTVSATDTEGLTVRQDFTVTVPNRAPVVIDTIRGQTLFKRDTVQLDLTLYFSDPDRDVLQYVIESSDSLVATASVNRGALTVRAGVKGDAAITVTATDPGGLAARQTFAVTVLNRAPIVVTPIPPQTIFRGLPQIVDVVLHFDDPDGDTLTYSAESSNRRFVRVEIGGSSLTLTAQRKGEAEVTVTATDPDSLAVQHTFAVTVGNREPVPVGTFPHLELVQGDQLTLPIDDFFRDPDRDVLEYEAITSEPGIARATARYGSLTLTGVSEGETELTLTATDPDGLSATQTSTVRVTGRDGDTPEAVGAIPPQTVAEGAVRTIAVAGYFRDPNGDPLAYSATTGDPNVATASASGTRVTLTGMASGRTSLTVTATDPGDLSTTLSTSVVVTSPGQGPVTTGSIPEQRVEIGQTSTLSVASYFQDPDGGRLDFAARSSNPGIVTAAVSGSDLTLTGVAEGSTAVTVTATDSDGLSVSQAASVRVEPQGRAPVAVGTIPAQSVEEGGFAVFDAAPYFREPAGASMRFDVVTSDPTVATAYTRGSNVTVLGVAEGATTLTVTATNAERLSATQPAAVEVVAGPPGPEPVGSVPSDSIMVGDELSIAMAPYFEEPRRKAPDLHGRHIAHRNRHRHDVRRHPEGGGNGQGHRNHYRHRLQSRREVGDTASPGEGQPHRYRLPHRVRLPARRDRRARSGGARCGRILDVRAFRDGVRRHRTHRLPCLPQGQV